VPGLSRAVPCRPRTTGALAEFGSVSRYCYQHSDVPLLLIPSAEAAAAASAAAARSVGRLAAPPTAVKGAATGEVAAPPAAADAEARTEKGSEILVVVNHLEELANVWQWLADNCARKGTA
jgi:hypothetical protein